MGPRRGTPTAFNGGMSMRTSRAVSQFWTYTPEEYLKLPVYGRDHPPCKAC